jgi:hypothetical protein
VSDVLGAGLTFLSSDPPSIGDAQTREWVFPDADLEPGEQLSITLVATASASCDPDPCRNDVSVHGLHDISQLVCPSLADRTAPDADVAEVRCGPEPEVRCCRLIAHGATASDGEDNTFGGAPDPCNPGGEAIAIEFGGTGSYRLQGGAEVEGASFERV